MISSNRSNYSNLVVDSAVATFPLWIQGEVDEVMWLFGSNKIYFVQCGYPMVKLNSGYQPHSLSYSFSLHLCYDVPSKVIYELIK